MRIFRRDWGVTALVPEWLGQLLIQEAKAESVTPEDVGRRLLNLSRSDAAIIEGLTPYFLRPYRSGDGTWWRVYAERRNPADLLGGVQVHVHIQFHLPLNRSQWFHVDALAYALCLPIESAVSMILTTSVFYPSLLRRVFCAVDHFPPLPRSLRMLQVSWHAANY